MFVCKERQSLPDYFSLWLRGRMVSILALAATGRSSAHTVLTLVNQMSSITELLRNEEPSFWSVT